MKTFTKKILWFSTILFVIYSIVNSINGPSSKFSAQSNNYLSDFNVGNLIKFDNPRVYMKKKLAVIVPIRNCLRNLLKFVPHLTKFLNAQQIPHHIFMVHQEDLLRFNRASLINIGYLYTKDMFDYTVQHDIDLLPLNPKLSYEFPGKSVFHVMNSEFHPHLNYRNIVSC
jgi:N-terminal region of glycosyl transferase group 7